MSATDAAATRFTRLRRWVAEPAVRQAAAATVATRLMVFLVGYLAVATIGHAPNVGPQPENELAGLPGRWDAGWYLGIAAGGYRYEGPEHRNPRLAFFPGYPLALRAAGRLLGLPHREPPWLWTGVAISCVFFFIALVYAHRLAERLIGADRAGPAIWLLACYPYSIFYGQVYTESLFLLVIAATWFYVETGRPLVAAIFSFAAGLVKPTGCLVALLAAWPAFQRLRATATPRVPIWPLAMVVAAPLLGLAAYGAFLAAITGDWLMWMTAHENWGRTVKSPIDLAGTIVAAVADRGLAGYLLTRPYDALNATAALFALASVVPVWRRFGPGAAAFVLMTVAIPLSAGGLMSLGRFTSVLLPTFLWLGARSRNPMALCAAFAIVQGLFAALFFTDRPIF